MVKLNQGAVLKRNRNRTKFPAQETSNEVILDSRKPVKGSRRLSH